MIARLGLVTLLLLVASTDTARSDVYEIPLPGLLGEYVAQTGSGSRIVEVQLPGIPAVIRGASLRVSGSATAGTLVCDGPATMPWITTIDASMSQATFRAWIIERAPENFGGPYGWTRAFVGWSAFDQPLPTWDLLMDGREPLRFVVMDNNVLLACFPGSAPPKVQVDEAVFVIDADFAVPATPQSWGRIKSGYR